MRADNKQVRKESSRRHRHDERNAEKYETILIRYRRDGSDGVTKSRIRAAAARSGLSVNAWLLDAIREAL